MSIVSSSNNYKIGETCCQKSKCLFIASLECGRGALLRRHVHEAGVGHLAAEVGQHALPLLLPHLRVEGLARDPPTLRGSVSVKVTVRLDGICWVITKWIAHSFYCRF